ncbi:MAG: hypothetical protein WCX90_03330 [Thiohalomonadaceae bacterium]
MSGYLCSSPEPGVYAATTQALPQENFHLMQQHQFAVFKNPLVRSIFCPWLVEKDITMSFANLNLDPSLLLAVEACGFTAPTEIQQQAVPVAISGRDIMASARPAQAKLLPSYYLPCRGFFNLPQCKVAARVCWY